VENCLVKIIWQEMWISSAKLLVKHSRSMYRDLCFVLKLIQVIIYIVMLSCRPNINLELSKAFLYEFLQSKMQNDSAKTFIKMCCNENFVQIENHMKWIHLCYMWMKHFGINTQSQRNIIQVDYNNCMWISQLHIFCLKHLKI
jgi:hypothetical protein